MARGEELFAEHKAQFVDPMSAAKAWEMAACILGMLPSSPARQIMLASPKLAHLCHFPFLHYAKETVALFHDLVSPKISVAEHWLTDEYKRLTKFTLMEQLMAECKGVPEQFAQYSRRKQQLAVLLSLAEQNAAAQSRASKPGKDERVMSETILAVVRLLRYFVADQRTSIFVDLPRLFSLLVHKLAPHTSNHVLLLLISSRKPLRERALAGADEKSLAAVVRVLGGELAARRASTQPGNAHSVYACILTELCAEPAVRALVEGERGRWKKSKCADWPELVLQALADPSKAEERRKLIAATASAEGGHLAEDMHVGGDDVLPRCANCDKQQLTAAVSSSAPDVARSAIAASSVRRRAGRKSTSRSALPRPMATKLIRRACEL